MSDFARKPLYDSKNQNVTSSFIDESIFYDLLVAHYTKLPWWQKMCENGLIITNADSNSNQLVMYKDKYNKRVLSISYNGELSICDKAGNLLFSNEKISREVIQLVQDYLSLSEGIKQIIFDLADIFDYEGLERMNHPIRKSTFEQRELAIKTLFLFCIYGGGISSKQLIHLVNILQEFEMSESLVCNSVKEIIEMDEKNMKEISKEITGYIGEKEKEYVIKDLCYLQELGNYSFEADERFSLLMVETFNVKRSYIENIRYKIKKEYING